MPPGACARFLCRFTDLTDAVLKREQELHLTRKDLAIAKKRLRTLGQDLARLKLSYRELYQNAPVMYFSLDIEGKFVTFNDTLLDTLGYERHELQNRDYTDRSAPADAAKLCDDRREHAVRMTGERETQWRKKDGTPIDVWLHTVPVYDEVGQLRPLSQCRSRSDGEEPPRQRIAGARRRTGADQPAAADDQQRAGGVHARRVARFEGAVADACRPTAVCLPRSTPPGSGRTGFSTSIIWSAPAGGLAR